MARIYLLSFLEKLFDADITTRFDLRCLKNSQFIITPVMQITINMPNNDM